MNSVNPRFLYLSDTPSVSGGEGAQAAGEPGHGLEEDRLHPPRHCQGMPEREFVIDNLLVRIHFIIEMIKWTGLAPWEF